jgi:hypothetical protein
MDETSGALRPAVEAYLNHEPMTEEQIAAMRAYLRQWMDWYGWLPGAYLDELRESIDDLTSAAAITKWLDLAIDNGIDPL